MSVQNFGNGDVQFLEPHCFGVLGVALLGEVDPEALEAVVKPFGLVKKATRAKKGTEEPAETDESQRTIVEIVESGPRDTQQASPTPDAGSPE